MNAVNIIAKKRDCGELSTEEIRFFIEGITNETIADYQAAAWLMAVYLRGMSRRETLDLTLAMRDSGETVDLSDIANGPTLDKHSTGGVGDKTSLVVVPILAAARVPILKMSGRGLGYSGGTVDKLESIPGFRTDLSIKEAKDVVNRVGAVMIGQSSQLAPADKILYSLRDVTATIESIPLIAASIMSKKLAAGGQRILLDVKCGQGAFMKTREQAELLAEELVAIGNGAGIPTVALLTRMDEPLGYAVGNALEVREAIETLGSLPPSPRPPVSESPSDVFLDLCLQLAAHGLVFTGKAATPEQGYEICAALVSSGAASRKFEEIIEAQGGTLDEVGICESLPKAAVVHHVTANQEGFIASVDAEEIGKIATDMGAGRQKKGDQIDHSVGIVLERKAGSKVYQDIRLAALHLSAYDIPRIDEFATRLRAAYRFTETKPQTPESLVLGVVR